VLGSIDGAAHVLQRRARDVILGAAVFMLPMLGLGVWFSILAYDDFGRLDGLFSDRGYIGAEAGGLLITLMVQSFTAHLVGAYQAALLVRLRLGGQARWRDAVLATLKRLPLLVLTWALTHWWAWLLALAILNSELPALVGLSMLLVPLATTASAMVLFTVPVMMTEHLGLKAIRRGWRLAKPRFGAVWGFVLAVGVLGFLLTGFITWLPQAAEATGLVTFGRFRWVLQGLASQIAALIVVPFAALATAEFYLQMRIHAEGLDIVMAADRAFGARQ